RWRRGNWCRRGGSKTRGVFADKRSVVGRTGRPFLSLDVQRNFSGCDCRRLRRFLRKLRRRYRVLEKDLEAIADVCAQHDRAWSLTRAEPDAAVIGNSV